jgi:opacity protein-like surface antigen
MKASALAVLMTALLASGPAARAAQNPATDNLHGSIGLGIGLHSIDGDFTGNSYYESLDNEVFVTPKIESGPSVTASVGIRYLWAQLELSAMRSSHDMEWQGVSYEGYRWLFSLNGRGYFDLTDSMEAYVLLGGGLGSVTVLNGYTRYDELGGDPLVDDLCYRGKGLNLGAGLEYRIFPRLSVRGGILYHPTDFFSVYSNSIEGGRAYAIDDLNEASIDFGLELVYYEAIK